MPEQETRIIAKAEVLDPYQDITIPLEVVEATPMAQAPVEVVLTTVGAVHQAIVVRVTVLHRGKAPVAINHLAVRSPDLVLTVDLAEPQEVRGEVIAAALHVVQVVAIVVLAVGLEVLAAATEVQEADLEVLVAATGALGAVAPQREDLPVGEVEVEGNNSSPTLKRTIKGKPGRYDPKYNSIPAK